MTPSFYSSQDGHYAVLIAPKDVTGGATSPAFALKQYAHASILLQIGVSAAAPTGVTLNACTDAAGSNPTPIAFDLFKQETSNGDVLGPRVAVTSAGFVPSANDQIFYVIEVNAQHLPQGFAYAQLAIANGVNSVLASAVALLSGARYASDQSATVLA